MGELVVMKKLDSIGQLVGDVSDLIEGVRTVVVVLLRRERKTYHLKRFKVTVLGIYMKRKRRADKCSNGC